MKNNGRQKIKIRVIQRNSKRTYPDPDDLVARKSCLNKKQYRTKRIAREAAKRLEKQFGTPYKAYRCRYDGRHHHLTTQVEDVTAPKLSLEPARPGAPEPLIQTLAGSVVRTMVKRL